MKSDFNFAKVGADRYLLTNYAGRYCFLTEEEFNAFRRDEPLPEETKQRLMRAFFFSDADREVFCAEYSEAVRGYRNYLFSGTGLHIFVLTTACNLKCLYCQASTREQGAMMNLSTAEKCVELALQSPNRYLSFEFQGGEPLMNFPALKHIVEYTEERAEDRVLSFNLVSNLTLLTEEMASFIAQHHISVSTSLDGDRLLHNRNRPFPGHDSFAVWKQKYDELRRVTGFGCGAIQTTTRFSLDRYRELVDAYVDLEFSRVFIRPLTPLGYAASRWDEIGYTAEAFLDFYRSAFAYILEKNRQGIHISEGHASILLGKILCHRAGNYTELTSPCGAALGQLAYNYDGRIYTCDEGRMLAEMGDTTFQLGTVDSAYADLFSGPTCRAVATASCLECIPQCAECVYSPYCGTCPVLTYYGNGSIFPSEPNSYKCKIYKGMLDVLFDILAEEDPQTLEILWEWV